MSETETLTVRVAEGDLRGQRVESRAGGFYWSFKGIPYASPPVGPLRFKDALPAEAWSGVRDAFAEGSNCTQCGPTGEVLGSEDCLFLNVYTPAPPARAAAAPAAALPAMVFLHGGGFEFGSGDSDFHAPDDLLADGVIVVTINYRLGVLGFLYLEEASPGNAGLKDQVAALRWVQRNIAAFGGDPNNVTLFGMSAGGASVHMHMLSPMSKGLFQRAVAMSGAAVNPWAQQTQPQETTRRLARLLGCTSDDPASIVDFLRTVDHKKLVRVAHTDAVPISDRQRLLAFSFVPTPEKVVRGVETFLPEPVGKMMLEGRHHAIPYMTGLAEYEANLILAFVNFRDKNVAKELDNKWEENILSELRIPPPSEKAREALDEMRCFFMDGKPLSEDTMKGFTDMLSDLTFHEGIATALRCMARRPKAPLYQYLFTLDDKLNVLKPRMNINVPGACHGDDLGYLFRAAFNDPDLPEDSVAALTRRRMVRLWTNFAKVGNPTPDDDPLLEVRWKPFTEHARNYLKIDAELQPGCDLYSDRLAFWEKFYETYRQR